MTFRWQNDTITKWSICWPDHWQMSDNIELLSQVIQLLSNHLSCTKCTMYYVPFTTYHVPHTRVTLNGTTLELWIQLYYTSAAVVCLSIWKPINRHTVNQWLYCVLSWRCNWTLQTSSNSRVGVAYLRSWGYNKLHVASGYFISLVVHLSSD